MDNYLFISVFVMFGGLSLLAHWCDAKYGWNISAWINGEQDSPFQASKSNPRQVTKEKEEIQQLKERIQVLERIVTEPSYELKKQIERC